MLGLVRKVSRHYTRAERNKQIFVQRATLAVLHSKEGRFVCLYCSRIETIRIPRAEGRGPPDGAGVKTTSIALIYRQTWKLGACKVAYNSRLRLTRKGGSVAEWLACWTQAQQGLGSNRSLYAAG